MGVFTRNLLQKLSCSCSANSFTLLRIDDPRRRRKRSKPHIKRRSARQRWQQGRTESVQSRVRHRPWFPCWFEPAADLNLIYSKNLPFNWIILLLSTCLSIRTQGLVSDLLENIFDNRPKEIPSKVQNMKIEKDEENFLDFWENLLGMLWRPLRIFLSFKVINRIILWCTFFKWFP